MKNNQCGQSTIEFIFTFVFGVSVILVVFNAAMNQASGYLVHYATFMASRSYLTADNYRGSLENGADDVNRYQTVAEERAREVFNQYNLGVFKVESSNFFINPTDASLSANEYLTVGTFTFFSQRIDVIGRVAGQSTLSLISESYLGKEPTRFSCAVQMCRAVTTEETCSPQMDITLFDDGC